jgi:hypothetical protein
MLLESAPMSLNKRRSRPIVVDGVNYRWRIAAVRHQDTDSYVLVVIQPTDNGQRIAIRVPSRDFYSDLSDANCGTGDRDPALYLPITPAFVQECIAAAREAGWSPLRSGPQLEFDLSELGLSR